MTEGLQVINMLMMAGSGLLGIGVGVGLFKSKVDQVLVDFTEFKKTNTEEHLQIKDRQSRLRGETNGGEPLFMPRIQCMQNRTSCMTHTENLLEDHTQDIKALNNFARWFMQEKGLLITEINDILGKK